MFRNRGKLPNINNGGNNGNNGGYNAPHYSHYWNGRFIVIRYDKTFIAIELIATFLILLVIFAVYLFAYPVTFEDQIAELKQTFLTGQLISIIISLVAVGIVTFFTRSSKENLIKNLRVVAILSILMIIMFFGIKLYIDSQYNENTFGEFYEKYENDNSNSKKLNTVSIGLSGIKISSFKNSYIEKNVESYTNFSIKTMLYMIIHIIVVIIIFYLSYRLAENKRKKEKLEQDDAILYDEEENVKF